MIKFGRDFVAKEPAGTPGANTPGVDVFWVAPHKVTESPLMRDFLRTCDDADLIDSPDLGRQAAVDAEDGAVDNGGENKEIEDLTTCFPYRSIAILVLALLVETVNLRNLTRLVISADKNYSIGVSGPGC